MDTTPKYVLKTNEALVRPKDKSKLMSVLRPLVWGLIAILVLGSLLLQENLFMEMNWVSRFLVIILVIRVLIIGGEKEDVPSPIELQFYDDCLILHRPKICYSNRNAKMEYSKFAYAGITKCLYLSKSKMLHIYGDMEARWYRYTPDGNLPSKPNYDGFVEKSHECFSTRCAQDVDFKQVIESNSPIQVTVEER